MLGRKKQNLQARQVRPEQSASVFSYHANRSNSEIAVGRNIATRSRKQFRWFLLPTYVAIAAICLSVLYLLSLETNPRLNVLGSEEDKLILQASPVYQKAAQDELNGSILNRSKLTLNTKTIAQKLQDRFPELSEVSITIPIGARRPIVEIQPAQPAMIILSHSGSFVIDANGKALVESNRAEKLKTLNLPIVTDESGLDIKPGTFVLPTDSGNFIDQTLSQLEAKGLAVETVTLPKTANELHVRLKGKGYYVKFNISGDARLQVGALVAVKERLEAEGKNPAEYIDVRVEEKVFYK